MKLNIRLIYWHRFIRRKSFSAPGKILREPWVTPMIILRLRNLRQVSSLMFLLTQFSKAHILKEETITNRKPDFI